VDLGAVHGQLAHSLASLHVTSQLKQSGLVEQPKESGEKGKNRVEILGGVKC
jgi:hypothetical protein